MSISTSPTSSGPHPGAGVSLSPSGRLASWIDWAMWIPLPRPTYRSRPTDRSANSSARRSTWSSRREVSSEPPSRGTSARVRREGHWTVSWSGEYWAHELRVEVGEEVEVVAVVGVSWSADALAVSEASNDLRNQPGPSQPPTLSSIHSSKVASSRKLRHSLHRCQSGFQTLNITSWWTPLASWSVERARLA